MGSDRWRGRSSKREQGVKGVGYELGACVDQSNVPKQITNGKLRISGKLYQTRNEEAYNNPYSNTQYVNVHSDRCGDVLVHVRVKQIVGYRARLSATTAH